MIELKEFRKVNNLTQDELGDYLGIKKSFISRIEHGAALLPEDKFNKLLANDKGWDVTVLKHASKAPKKKIPIYKDISSIGGKRDLVADVEHNSSVPEWIDAGDWFPTATAAITHYGDSMLEYPSGSILVLKRVQDVRLLINGADYVIETTEFRITKKLQYQDGWDFIMAHSTNMEKYQDGSLVYAPIKIPLDTIRHIDLVVGCVNKKFANGPASIIVK